MPLNVKVRNFQSIESAEITIDRLTVITGTNNAGKSAFFRAIRGAFTNAPGFDFVRYGKQSCRVDIVFDDKKTLSWEKGKNINSYFVNGHELSKVGVGVPPEVQVFGVDPILVGKTELWPQIASQIVGVSFLLHEPGSVIAEAVANVDRVNQLSRALKSCESDRRSARSELKVRKKESSILAEKIERFVGLEELVEKIESLQKDQEQIDKISKAIEGIYRIKKRLDEARDVVRLLQGVEKIDLPAPEKLQESYQCQELYRTYQEIRTRYHKAQKEVQFLHAVSEIENILPIQEKVDKAVLVRDTLYQTQQLKERRTSVQKDIKNLEMVSSLVDLLPKESSIEHAQKLQKGLQVTMELASKLDSAVAVVQQAKKAHQNLSFISFDESPINQCRKIKTVLQEAKELQLKHQESKGELDKLIHLIDIQIQEQSILTDQLNTILGEYKECPTCGSTLEHIHE